MGGEGIQTTDERRQFGASVDDRDFEHALVAANPRHLSPVRRLEALAPSPIRLRSVLRAAFDDEIEHGNDFLFVPVFLAAGALVYFWVDAEPDFVPLALTALLLATLCLLSRRRQALRAGLLALLLVVAGMLAAKAGTWRTATPMLGSQITTMLAGRVVRVEHQASGRVRLTLDVLGTERPQLRHAPDRVRASAREVPEGVAPGAVLRGPVRLMPPSGPVRPQSYDFSFRSYHDGIGAVGFFLGNPEHAVGEWPPAPMMLRADAWVEGWRQKMAARIETTIGGAEGAIAAALITGVRAGIPEDISEALRVVGLYHVISISGLHMALVAGTLMVALRFGFALAPSFSLRRPVKKYAAAVALLATALYLFISGSDVAAQRAFIMLAVMLVAVICDRAALTMRNLAISAIIILALAPHEVVGPSFQMSFAATAALVAAFGAWSARREGRLAPPPARRSAALTGLRNGARYAVGLSATSVVAGVATALFSAWHFQQVSPMGLFANLAAMPVVSVIVMPMGVLAALAMPFGLDAAPLYLMGQGIALMNAIAMWLAQRSAFDATGAIPLSAVLVLTAALAVLAMAGSALRWAAAPLVVTGLALLVFSRAVPDAFIAEDGRLVAMRLTDGKVAVNRPRPRAFTIDNWLRAFGDEEVALPRKVENDLPMQLPTGEGFLCAKGLCAARHAGGAIIVHARDAVSAASACTYAAVIVIDDATARNPCGDGAHVVTKRDLARRGSAAVTFSGPPDAVRAKIRFSIAEPYRPWHRHRQYSREARGLPPYRREQKPESPEVGE